MTCEATSLQSLDIRPCTCVPRLVSWLLVGALVLGSVAVMAQTTVVLVGSGSSVPASLYTRWAGEYGKRSAHIQMRYVPIGTSEGIKQISHGSGDFGAGEVLLTAKERGENGLIALPAVLIGIVPIYNLPDLHRDLRLSGELLAAIFMGEVKNWDSPQIARLNPDASLPNVPIRVVYRPAGKGSNYVFTDFLSQASSRFREQIGVTPSPNWPVGVAAERSSDMVDKVKSEPGSIGFVELQYAVKGNLQQAAVLNSAGKFVEASGETITAACHSVEAPQWERFSASLVNAPGADSFPIVSFSWIYLRAAPGADARQLALTDFLNWMFSDGQQLAGAEGYSPLPPPLLASVKRKIKSLR